MFPAFGLAHVSCIGPKINVFIGKTYWETSDLDDTLPGLSPGINLEFPWYQGFQNIVLDVVSIKICIDIVLKIVAKFN